MVECQTCTWPEEEVRMVRLFVRWHEKHVDVGAISIFGFLNVSDSDWRRGWASSGGWIGGGRWLVGFLSESESSPE